MRLFTSSLIYVLLFVPSLLIVAALWSALVSGRLFYCWDSTPLVDFIPPFVHSTVDARDHYIAQAWQVWSLWSLFLATAFVVPLFWVPFVRRRVE
jgi:hypothetical protein